MGSVIGILGLDTLTEDEKNIINRLKPLSNGRIAIAAEVVAKSSKLRSSLLAQTNSGTWIKSFIRNQQSSQISFDISIGEVVDLLHSEPQHDDLSDDISVTPSTKGPEAVLFTDRTQQSTKSAKSPITIVTHRMFLKSAIENSSLTYTLLMTASMTLSLQSPQFRKSIGCHNSHSEHSHQDNLSMVYKKVVSGISVDEDSTHLSWQESIRGGSMHGRVSFMSREPSQLPALVSSKKFTESSQPVHPVHLKAKQHLEETLSRCIAQMDFMTLNQTLSAAHGSMWNKDIVTLLDSLPIGITFASYAKQQAEDADYKQVLLSMQMSFMNPFATDVVAGTMVALQNNVCGSSCSPSYSMKLTMFQNMMSMVTLTSPTALPAVFPMFRPVCSAFSCSMNSSSNSQKHNASNNLQSRTGSSDTTVSNSRGSVPVAATTDTFRLSAAAAPSARTAATATATAAAAGSVASADNSVMEPAQPMQVPKCVEIMTAVQHAVAEGRVHAVVLPYQKTVTLPTTPTHTSPNTLSGKQAVYQATGNAAQRQRSFAQHTGERDSYTHMLWIIKPIFSSPKTSSDAPESRSKTQVLILQYPLTSLSVQVITETQSQPLPQTAEAETAAEQPPANTQNLVSLRISDESLREELLVLQDLANLLPALCDL